MGGSIMASIINASTSGAGGVITTADASGQLELQTAGVTRQTIDVNGNVGIGTGSPSAPLEITRDGDTMLLVKATNTGGGTDNEAFLTLDSAPGGESQIEFKVDGVLNSRIESFETGNLFQITAVKSGMNIAFRTEDTERARIDTSGNVLVGITTTINVGNATNTGIQASQDGEMKVFRSGATVLTVGRQTNDGALIDFRQAGVTEGSISVSGTTVSYNGGHISRWSQLYNETEKVEVYRGTVLESVDAMCKWYDEEGNLLPNEQATKTIVSTTPASKAVAGVFDRYDEDDEDNPYDFYVAQSGDFIIRVAAGTVVQNGDLLESAGDGTARVQADDICRSSTIAKVTSNYVSETYADGSFCVPCILMIG
jgi:hypothetical protein